MILLPSKEHKKAREQEISLKLNLESSLSLMRNGDRDIVLDLNKLYDEERLKSVKYKVYGKMKMIFRNLYSGVTSYPYLEERLYLVGDGTNNDFTGFLPYNEFAFLRRDIYREVNTPQSGNVLGVEYSPTSTIVESTDHVPITTLSAPYHNWNVYLSYVFGEDENFPMNYTLSNGNVFSFYAKDGIPFEVIDNDNTYTLISPIPHGIKQGEYIIIDEVPYYVNGIGNEKYKSENFVITLQKTQFLEGTTITGVICGKRCLDSKRKETTTSKYYVHKHKTITDVDDYILDNVGFESPIFEDERKILLENSVGKNDVLVERNRMESVLFDFKTPLYLSGITNNLGFTPTDVYITVIYRNGNGYFDYPPKIGYKFNFHDNWVDEHFHYDSSYETNLTSTSINKSGITFKTGNTLPKGSELYGDFIEYNEKEMIERVISETFHKIINPTEIFNYGQNYRTNNLGLFYKPHNKVKLRQLSPYIETAKTYDINNLPENSIYDGEENIWRWRDLYDHGYIDTDGYGTNYPYLNDIHYVKCDINFYLRNENTYRNKVNDVIDFNKRYLSNRIGC